MATIDLGKIRFNWQGVFNNSVSYVKNDIVSNGGGTYICKLPATGIAVSNTTYWDIMSSPGTNGTNGTNGTDVGTVITTQGDVLYRDGSGLQRLAKGTASQQLAMNSGATAPEWVTPAAGGAWTLLQTVSMNSVYNNFTAFDDTTYSTHAIVLDNAQMSVADYLWFQGSSDGGSTWITTTSYYNVISTVWQSGATSASVQNVADNTNHGALMDSVKTSPEPLSAVIYFTNKTGGTYARLFGTVNSNTQSGYAAMHDFHNLMYKDINAIRLYTQNSYTFNGGTAYLYGVSKT